jgi:uncharacterized iron-regulated membrane protein
MIRKFLFWSHLVIGLLTGVFVFVLCLTGAVLAFEQQIVDWAERDVRASPPSDTTPFLPPKAIVAGAAKVEPATPSGIEWFADPQMPVRVRYPEQKLVLINGYTAEVLGRGATDMRAFMRWNVELHTNLTVKAVGRWAVSFANAGFVFLIASGAWLWWPRHWRWKVLRNSIAIRFNVRGKARDWNWHNVFAFWFFLPLAVIALTGLVLSFGAVDRWWKEFASARVLAPSVPAGRVSTSAVSPPTDCRLGWLQGVGQRYPAWRSMTLNGSGNTNADGQYSLMVHEGMPRHRLSNRSVIVDARSKAVLRESDWSGEEPKNRARAIARLGHTGELLGLWGQWLAFLTSLAGLVLVYTGFALSWRRFFPRRKARPSQITE